jgi:acetyltransferase-like isoleucine patch superfamily enzyme
MFIRLKELYYHWCGKRRMSKLAEDHSIGIEFCSSPMFSDKYVHIYKNIKLSGSPGSIKLGKFCNISLSLNIINNGKAAIGDYVYMNSGCRFYISNNLTIGSHCLFGPSVVIWDSDNHPLDPEERREQAEIIPYRKLNSFNIGGGDITIDDNVWIGMESLILGGVKIGRGSVIAARSVVTHDIPEMVLAAGVPARVIRPINA